MGEEVSDHLSRQLRSFAPAADEGSVTFTEGAGSPDALKSQQISDKKTRASAHTTDVMHHGDDVLYRNVGRGGEIDERSRSSKRPSVQGSNPTPAMTGETKKFSPFPPPTTPRWVRRG